MLTSGHSSKARDARCKARRAIRLYAGESRGGLSRPCSRSTPGALMRTAYLRLLLPTAVLALFTGSGCAFLSRMLQAAFVQPELTFKSASVGGFSLNDATINLAWELRNPNPVGVSLASLNYAL